MRLEPEPNTLVYEGSSMNPMFRPSDLLCYIPYAEDSVRAGDVVVFFSQSPDKKKAVHRVISVNRGKITTRGDNNDRADSKTLKSEDIIGRVVRVKRGPKSRRVPGGKAGLALFFFLKIRRYALERAYLIFGPAYRRIAKDGLVNRIFSSLSKKNVYYFDRPAGREVQIIIGRRMVARRTPAGRWLIKRPFKLFIDTKTVK